MWYLQHLLQVSAKGANDLCGKTFAPFRANPPFARKPAACAISEGKSCNGRCVTGSIAYSIAKNQWPC